MCNNSCIYYNNNAIVSVAPLSKCADSLEVRQPAPFPLLTCTAHPALQVKTPLDIKKDLFD